MKPQENLTTREIEILAHLAEGLQNKELAHILNITEGTVEQHLKRIYKKLDVTNRTEAAKQFYLRYR